MIMMEKNLKKKKKKKKKKKVDPFIHCTLQSSKTLPLQSWPFTHNHDRLYAACFNTDVISFQKIKFSSR